MFFLSNFVPVQHPTQGVVPFKLYPFQADTMNEIAANRFVIINKSRQMGISTLLAGYILWKMLFNENFKALVVATNTAVAGNLIEKIRFMNRELPEFLKKKEGDDNKMSLEFKSNSSRVKAVSSSPNATRSEALSLLVIDEAAFVAKFDELWTAAQPTLATGGDCVMLSTPNGYGNLFAKIWHEAILGEGRFKAVELPWDLHPDRDQSWRDEQTVLLGKKKAEQECDCSFLASGDTLIDGHTLKWYRDNVMQDPISKEGMNQAWWIWKYPQQGVKYVSIVDVARGDGTDFGTVNIIEVDTMEQVAEFKAKIPPEDLAKLAVSKCVEYNSALLVIENNNMGYSAVIKALELYNNIYYSPRDSKKNMGIVDPNTDVPGFTTSTFTRPLMVNAMDKLIHNKNVIIRSERSIAELEVFIWKAGKVQAQIGFNDDLAMTWGMYCYLKDYAFTRLSAHQRNIESDPSNILTNYVSVGPNRKKDPWVHSIGNVNMNLRDLL